MDNFKIINMIMKNLQKNITEKFGVDKLLHFAFGGWIACLAPDWYCALLIGVVVGFSKEVFDKYVKKSKFDYWDIIATIAGSALTAIYMLF